MEGCKQMNHFWNWSNFREALIQPLKVNSPKTKQKKPQPHVVHTNALEWSTRAVNMVLFVNISNFFKWKYIYIILFSKVHLNT